MPLGPGTRIGPYEITAEVGMGGMGEVYRARDTNLKRTVAIKVLPAAFARDREGVARLRREAEVLASLSHPNIAAIYGLESTEESLALALEFVEGEDLAQRLARGALPETEVIGVARQIVDALEAAHDKGIVHRDLKPANIKVTRDGVVKVLDFGLAKASAAGAADEGNDVSQSPTLAHNTEAGVILGTAAYMSPEQARGRPVDKRADIWAFGVVLFELLTGRTLFHGETMSDTLAAVLTREPDWTLLPQSTPAGVRRLLARSLERNPKRRLRDIGDARPDLEQSPDSPVTRVRSRWWRRPVPWAVGVGIGLVAGWALWGRTSRDTGSHELLSVDIALPTDIPLSGSGLGISPDGRSVVLTGSTNGVRRMFLRRLDRGEASDVPGGAGANSAAFSPDGSSLAFVPGNGSIVRLSIADQQRKVVVESGVDIAGGLVWSPAGIIFIRGGALWIVSPDGGSPRPLTTLDASRREVIHQNPVVLPGARLVLFASMTTDAGAERIEAVPIDGGPRSVVVERATTPVWSPTGHLLFARDDAVLAAVMDPKTATLAGPSLPVMPPGVVEVLASGALGFTLSPTGTLLYLPAGMNDKRLTSVGRDGAAMTLPLPAGRYVRPRISPDGHRLLIESGGRVLETLDVARGTRASLTAPALGTAFSTWSADGRRVVFRRFNTPSWVAVDGGGDAVLVPGTTANDFPCSPGPDADSVLVVRVRRDTSGDVFLMSLSGAFEPRPLIVTSGYDGGPQLSPDREWLVYQSDVSGRPEIYVRRFSSLDRQWQVSGDGGVQPRWSRSAPEIYYRDGRRILSVRMSIGSGGPAFGKPTAVFDDEYDYGGVISIANYDTTLDGRFLMLRHEAMSGKLRVVLNWTQELKRILAAGGVR